MLRGEPSSNEFMAFWVVPEGDGVRVLAGMHVNVWDTIDDVQRLVRDRTVVDRARLTDPEVPLGDARPDGWTSRRGVGEVRRTARPRAGVAGCPP